jgi:putative transposase
MLKSLLQSFLLMLASSTDKELAQVVEYLKAENRILRERLPKRLDVTPKERATLLRLGRKLGTKIRSVITIVTPRTFLRWLKADDGTPATAKPNSKRGRKPTLDEVRALILKLARENAWGYTRILGELKKLGVGKLSRATVANILKDNGLDPGPRRGEGTWDDFLKRHAETLWACDFFSTKVWTMSGLVDVFVLFFVHVGSRRVHLAGVSANPDRAWMVQQARNVAMRFDKEPVKPKYLLRDRDTKFVAEFDAILASEGVEVRKVAVRAPNQNAVAERFVQTVRQECLDHFLVVSEKHLRHLLSEFLIHYHEERPHQGLGNVPLSGTPPSAEEPAILPLSEVRCRERLGGLLKHYRRAA